MNALALAFPQENNSKFLSTSLETLFTEYKEKRAGIEAISKFVSDKSELTTFFLQGNRVQSFMAKEIFQLEGAISALNAEYWSRVIAMTDVLECMPADKRNEWSAMIHDMKTPDFIKDDVISTIHNLLLSREMFLAHKVDGLFRKLSGNHLTNAPHGFKKRLIVEYVIGQFEMLNYDRVEYLHDLRSIIAKLMGRDAPKTSNTRSDLDVIIKAGNYGEWNEFDGGAIKIKLFKKGTAHMEIHPDIAISLNNILATLHPHAIPSSSRKKEAGPAKEVPLKKNLIPFEVTSKLSDVFNGLSRGRLSIYLSSEDTPSHVMEGVEEVLSFLGGTKTDHEWVFTSDVSKALATVIRTGCLPEISSHQFYPTKKELALRLVEMADIHASDRILEPSAGQGGIADHLPKAQTTCVEISDVNAQVLKGKGFQVIEGDFLKVELKKLYSRILMNPPFAKGQAESHLRHASTLLEANGRLLAILPASLKGKDLLPGFSHTWSEVIENAFEGTGVRVVILEASRKS